MDLLSEWTGKVSSFLILALSLVVGFEVTARYVFKHPTIWASETSAMIFGVYIIIGGAYTLQLGSHANMDLVYGCFTPRGRALLDIVTFWVFAFFCVVLIWTGGETSWRSFVTLEHSSSIWNPPVYPIRAILPLGAFLLLLQGIAKFVRDVTTLIKREPQ